MGVNNLPKTVTRQRPGCDLNPGPPAPEYSTLTTQLPSYLLLTYRITYRTRPHRRTRLSLCRSRSINCQ